MLVNVDKPQNISVSGQTAHKDPGAPGQIDSSRRPIPAWRLPGQHAGVVDRLVEKLGLSPTMARVLANRGIADPDAARDFLNPSLSQLHDPVKMRDMEAAVDTIESAVRDERYILVWGDYDVDGVTSTVLLYDFLRRHVARGELLGYYIPHRTEEGYALNEAALRRLAVNPLITKGKRGLIVTVDCGVSNAAEVDLADLLDFDVVITDHHTPPATLPAAKAVINPHRTDCEYPFKSLAGVGIAFKLVQALARRLDPGHPSDDLDSYLDLVALGTVADIAPLLGENRVLVHHGLAVLGSSGRPGVRALLEISRIDRRPLRSSQISFGLGPRINAAGRLKHAGAAVELLLSRNIQEARERAAVLEDLNNERRRIESRIREEAIQLVETSPGLLSDGILVLAGKDWHPGVVGIVAAKIAERYGRPALLIATGNEPALAKGSARSFGEIDLYARLDRCRRLFTSLGGHSHAAGFSIREEDVAALRRELNLDADGTIRLPTPLRSIDIDALLNFKDIGPCLSRELRRLAPFGQRNPEPTFATRDVRLAQPPRTVGNNHLRLTLAHKTPEPERTAVHRHAFIGFNLGDLANDLAEGMRVDVAFDLDLEGGSSGSWERLRLRGVAAPAAR